MLEDTHRRAVLAAGAAALATGALAGCGDSDTSKDTTKETGGREPGAPASSPGASPTDSASAAPAGEPLVKTADVPVGGGTVVTDQKVVVTQPKSGEFKAFSAVCTHRGCLVNKVADGTIDCPCHGSKYAIADAKVVAGPAPRPLPEKKITVENGEIRLA